MSTFTVDEPSPTGLASLNFRLRVPLMNGLKELSKRTRVRQSEYLREAITDLLAKYEEKMGVCDGCSRFRVLRRVGLRDAEVMLCKECLHE